MFKRALKIELPKKQSTFLWGARKTGKSTYLKQYFTKSLYYDFLKSDDYLRYSKAPYLLRQEILAKDPKYLQNPIIIDEVQKIPKILDEVHWMIENANLAFILCGSSARKLKQKEVNLLGGRAWKYQFFPLTYSEITDFDLLTALNNGTIPAHYLSTNIKKSFKSYIEDYLIQEIQTEGLVRNLPAFARFIDIMPFSNTEMINYSNIARDCSVDAKTVKEYFNILVDTMLGYYVYPLLRTTNRQVISSVPKFYLFDTGISTHLAKRQFLQLAGSEVGKALENYILQELMAYNSISEHDAKINYWRTKTGIEVDFVIDSKVAVEVKTSQNIHHSDLKGLKVINSELQLTKSILVCNETKERALKFNDFTIYIMPIKIFLEKLWQGDIF